MQTILGANGVIAFQLAKYLKASDSKIRLVSSAPVNVNKEEELMRTNLMNPRAVSKTVNGSDIVYLVGDLTFKTKTWQEQWPVIMRNVMDACMESSARLVFFDNVYAYGKVEGWMNENTPYNPSSKKGEVRAVISTFLMNEVNKNNLTAMIVRAGDLYGPATTNSLLNSMVIEKINNGRRAQWLVNPHQKHSFTYTPDAAKAIAMLGNTNEAYNQVWHLPTDPGALTGEELIQKIAVLLKKSSKYIVLKKWMLKMITPFSAAIRENMELLYQYEQPYLFDSAKFNSAFPFNTTSYDAGLNKSIFVNHLM